MKWEKLKLEEIGLITSGGTPSTGNPGYWNGEIPWITPKDLSNFEYRYIENGERNITDDGFKNSSAKLVKEKSVLLSSRAPIGYLAIAQNDLTTNQGFKNITPNKKCDYIYLFYCLKNNVEYLKSLGIGATYPELSSSRLKEIQIPVPPLPTQRRIASILSAYDDLIENNLKRIKLLEEKAELRYKLMQKELTYEKRINLYDFADIQMGFAFKAEAFNEDSEGIPIIRIRDIPRQMTKSYTIEELENQYWVEKGDLLIGMDGEFHMNEWLGQRGYIVQRVCRLRAKNELFQSFLWQALKEPIHYYESTISGATVAHLGKKHLEEILIAQPKDSMKNELEEMNTMRKIKIVLADQNTKLREARDILLPRLMSGEINF